MVKKSKQFDWRPGDKPPELEMHSDAKLRLLEAYLDRYFDVVCAQPKMDVLRISLVDAFSGGGVFRLNGLLRDGSPLAMINAVRRAEARINASRRKPLRVDAKFYFVDSDRDAIDCLKQTLETVDLPQHIRDSITIKRAAASDVLPGIVGEITGRTRLGRSIFFLDQCGLKDAPNRDIRLIYGSLPKSEVIVTYNYGAIHDYMSDHAAYLASMAPLELGADDVRALLAERGRQGGRYLAGRLLGSMLKNKVGSTYMSRFFLRSEKAHRDMWFVHYSKVPRSRLVMSEAHWAIKNWSVTQGDPGLDMLGFKPSWKDQIELDFTFEDRDEGRIHHALMTDLPDWLGENAEDSGLTFETLLARSADKTAATQTQFVDALGALENEGEIEIWTPGGGRRKKSDADLKGHHRIALPRQGRFFF